jgi:hypothetical protein
MFFSPEGANLVDILFWELAIRLIVYHFIIETKEIFLGESVGRRQI